MLLLATSRTPRRRPPGLAYGADERPPAMAIGILAGQHAAMALALVAYVVVAASLAGLSTDEVRTLVAGSIICMGAGTILQAVGGRYGAGALMVHIPSPVHISIAAVALKAMGPVALFYVAFADGLSQLLVSRVLPKLRTLFPPVVAGIIVLLAGLGMVGHAAETSLGLAKHDGPTNEVFFTTLVTLATIVAFSIWGNAALRLFGMLAGVTVGVILAAVTGELHGIEQLADTPLFGVPTLALPSTAPDPGLILTVVIMGMVLALDSLGVVILMDKMDNADWRRPDLDMVARAVQANGVANMIGAFFAALPTGISSANIGLCHVSRTTSRVVGLVAGLLFLVVAFLPQVIMAIVLLPEPVLGAVQIYASAYLIASGMELIGSRAMDSRGIFLVGLSVLTGMAVLMVEEIGQTIPEWSVLLVTSPMIAGGVLAIVLNQLFRLGTKQRIHRPVPEDAESPARAVADMVEHQCGHWATRRDVARRATLAALEASEALLTGDPPRRILALEGSFDEYNLHIVLVHDGPPLPLKQPAQAADLTRALEGGEAEMAAVLAALSSTLVSNLADRVSVSEDPDGTRLALRFEH